MPNPSEPINIGGIINGKSFNSDEIEEFKLAISTSASGKMGLAKFLSGIDEEVVENFIFTSADHIPQLLYEFKNRKSIRFNKCTFTVNSIEGLHQNLFFNKCIFKASFNPTSNFIFPNIKIKSIFHECHFNKGIHSVNPSPGNQDQIENLQFRDCDIDSITLENYTIPNKLFYKSNQDLEKIIESINLKDCHFKERLTLKNNLTSNEVNIENCKFDKKFEINKSKLKKLSIKNSNFNEIADFHGTESEELEIEQCVFKDFFVFENCKIGNNEIIKKSNFKYTTFKDFVSFRDSNFNNGLDLSKINSLGRINFSGISVCKEKTTLETFRLIKHTLDSEGSHLEANKYFAMEMDSYSKELKKDGKPQDIFVYWLNKKISNFGQNYLSAIYWILSLMSIMTISVWAHCKNFPYKQLPWTKDIILPVANGLNNFSKNYLILGKILPEGLEFISLAITIMMTICMWQLVVALKRYTRR